MAATMDKLDIMARILEKTSLGHLTELFHREKITPDIISMLSAHEMNQLGITSRVDMMNLRLQCCTYGRQKPEKNRVGCGAPEFNIPKSVLEDQLEEGFTIQEACTDCAQLDHHLSECGWQVNGKLLWGLNWKVRPSAVMVLKVS